MGEIMFTVRRVLRRLTHWAALASLIMGSGIADATARAGAEPLAIQKGIPQLFVDDYLIESQSGLTRTLHQPRKDDGGNVPVIALDKEFGGAPCTLEANGTIVYDPRLKKWVMFAVALS